MKAEIVKSEVYEAERLLSGPKETSELRFLTCREIFMGNIFQCNVQCLVRGGRKKPNAENSQVFQIWIANLVCVYVSYAKGD